MRHRALKLVALGLVLYGAFGLSIAIWGTWFYPKPTWQEWWIYRRWEPGVDRGAPSDDQSASQMGLYDDRKSCEESGRAGLQKLQRMLADMAATPEQISLHSSLHLSEDGLEFVDVNVVSTTSRQVVCLQVGQRPEGL